MAFNMSALRPLQVSVPNFNQVRFPQIGAPTLPSIGMDWRDNWYKKQQQRQAEAAAYRERTTHYSLLDPILNKKAIEETQRRQGITGFRENLQEAGFLGKGADALIGGAGIYRSAGYADMIDRTVLDWFRKKENRHGTFHPGMTFLRNLGDTYDAAASTIKVPFITAVENDPELGAAWGGLLQSMWMRTGGQIPRLYNAVKAGVTKDVDLAMRVAKDYEQESTPWRAITEIFDRDDIPDIEKKTVWENYSDAYGLGDEGRYLQDAARIREGMELDAGGPVGNFAIDFGFEVALDPANWVSFGGAALGKKAITEGGEGILRATAGDIARMTGDDITRYVARNTDTMATGLTKQADSYTNILKKAVVESDGKVDDFVDAVRKIDSGYVEAVGEARVKDIFDSVYKKMNYRKGLKIAHSIEKFESGVAKNMIKWGSPGGWAFQGARWGAKHTRLGTHMAKITKSTAKGGVKKLLSAMDKLKSGSEFADLDGKTIDELVAEAEVLGNKLKSPSYRASADPDKIAQEIRKLDRIRFLEGVQKNEEAVKLLTREEDALRAILNDRTDILTEEHKRLVPPGVSETWMKNRLEEVVKTKKHRNPKAIKIDVQRVKDMLTDPNRVDDFKDMKTLNSKEEDFVRKLKKKNKELKDKDFTKLDVAEAQIIQKKKILRVVDSKKIEKDIADLEDRIQGLRSLNRLQESFQYNEMTPGFIKMFDENDQVLNYFKSQSQKMIDEYKSYHSKVFKDAKTRKLKKAISAIRNKFKAGEKLSGFEVKFLEQWQREYGASSVDDLLKKIELERLGLKNAEEASTSKTALGISIEDEDAYERLYGDRLQEIRRNLNFLGIDDEHGALPGEIMDLNPEYAKWAEIAKKEINDALNQDTIKALQPEDVINLGDTFMEDALNAIYAKQDSATQKLNDIYSDVTKARTNTEAVHRINDTQAARDNFKRVMKQKIEDSTFVTYDIETTSQDISRARVVQIAAKRFKIVDGKRELIDEFETVMKVDSKADLSEVSKILPKTTQTKILNSNIEDVDGLKSFIDYLGEDDILMAHNGRNFDVEMLRNLSGKNGELAQQFKGLNNAHIESMDLFKSAWSKEYLDGNLDKFKQGHLIEKRGFENDVRAYAKEMGFEDIGLHDADVDTYAHMLLFDDSMKTMGKEVKTIGDMTDIFKSQGRYADRVGVHKKLRKSYKKLLTGKIDASDVTTDIRTKVKADIDEELYQRALLEDDELIKINSEEMFDATMRELKSQKMNEDIIRRKRAASKAQSGADAVQRQIDNTLNDLKMEQSVLQRTTDELVETSNEVRRLENSAPPWEKHRLIDSARDNVKRAELKMENARKKVLEYTEDLKQHKAELQIKEELVDIESKVKGEVKRKARVKRRQVEKIIEERSKKAFVDSNNYASESNTLVSRIMSKLDDDIKFPPRKVNEKMLTHDIKTLYGEVKKTLETAGKVDMSNYKQVVDKVNELDELIKTVEDTMDRLTIKRDLSIDEYNRLVVGDITQGGNPYTWLDSLLDAKESLNDVLKFEESVTKDIESTIYGKGYGYIQPSKIKKHRTLMAALNQNETLYGLYNILKGTTQADIPGSALDEFLSGNSGRNRALAKAFGTDAMQSIPAVKELVREFDNVYKSMEMQTQLFNKIAAQNANPTDLSSVFQMMQRVDKEYKTLYESGLRGQALSDAVEDSVISIMGKDYLKRIGADITTDIMSMAKKMAKDNSRTFLATPDAKFTNAVRNGLKDVLLDSTYGVNVKGMTDLTATTTSKIAGKTDAVTSDTLVKSLYEYLNNSVESLRTPLRKIKTEGREMKRFGVNLGRFQKEYGMYPSKLIDAGGDFSYVFDDFTKAEMKKKRSLYQIIEGLTSPLDEVLPVWLDTKHNELYKGIQHIADYGGTTAENLSKYIGRHTKDTQGRAFRVSTFDALLHEGDFPILEDIQNWIHKTFKSDDATVQYVDDIAELENRIKAGVMDYFKEIKPKKWTDAVRASEQSGGTALKKMAAQQQLVRDIHKPFSGAYQQLRKSFQSNEDFFSYLQRNEDMNVYILAETKSKHAKTGMRYKKVQINNIDDVNELNGIDPNLVAVGDTHLKQVLDKMTSYEPKLPTTLDYFRRTVWQPLKSVSLNNAGFILNNLFDIPFKNQMAQSGGAYSLGVTSKYGAAAKMYKNYFKKYTEALDLLPFEEFGHSLKYNWIDDITEKFPKYFDDIELEELQKVHEFISSPAAASEAQELLMHAAQGDVIGEKKISTGFEKFINKVFYDSKIGSLNLRVNSKMEGVGRLALYLDSLDSGLTKNEGLNKVLKTHFNYGNKSTAEMGMEFLIPFLSYALRNAEFAHDILGDPKAAKFISDMYLNRLDKEKGTYNTWDFDSQYKIDQVAGGIVDVGLKDFGLRVGMSPMEGLGMMGDPLGTGLKKVSPLWKGAAGKIRNVEADQSFGRAFSDNASFLEERLGGYNNESWKMIPGISHARAAYGAGQTATTGEFALDKVSPSLWKKQYHSSNYYGRKAQQHYRMPNSYKSMYTSSGKSRLELRAMPTNPENLNYKISDIMWMYRG